MLHPFKKLFAAALALSLCGFAHAAPRYKHVVLIGSDGFSAEVVAQNPGKFPNLERLMASGSWTLHARTVLPSSSAINWATILMGAGSEMHGFTDWGSKTPEVKPVYTTHYGMFPGIFGQLRDQRPAATAGVIYSWEGIGYLFEKQAVNLDRFVSTDDSVAQEALRFIDEQKPALTFVYFSAPDGAGHSIGWLTPEYIAAAQKVDSLVGAVVAGIETSLDPKQTAIIFTSDHGGKDKGHGGKTMSEMEAPFIMVGRGIPAGHEIDRVVMMYDNAPTMADMLGITSPEQWRGKSLFSK